MHERSTVEVIPQIGGTVAQDSTSPISPRATTPGDGVFGKELKRQIQTSESGKEDQTAASHKSRKSGDKALKNSKTKAEGVSIDPQIWFGANLANALAIPTSLAETTGNPESQPNAVGNSSSNRVVAVQEETKATAITSANVTVTAEVGLGAEKDENAKTVAEVTTPVADMVSPRKVESAGGSKQSSAAIETAQGNIPDGVPDPPMPQPSIAKMTDTTAAKLSCESIAGNDSDKGASQKHTHRASGRTKDDLVSSHERPFMAPRGLAEPEDQKPKPMQGPDIEAQGREAPAASPAPADAVPIDTIAQMVRSIPLAMEGAAAKVASKEVAASAAKSPEPGEENAVKTAVPGEKHTAVKEQKDSAGTEGKRSETGDDSRAIGQNSAQAAHEQVKPEAISNGEKSAGLFHRVQPTANSGNSPARETDQVGQHESFRPGSADLPVANASPAEVLHAVRMFERDGQSEMHIGVRSEALGVVDVKATVHDGNVGVSIGVERHELRSALVSELPGLENTLRDHDLRLGEVRFHDTGSALASGHDRGQQRQPQDFLRPFAPAFFGNAKVATEKVELPVEFATTSARSGISIRV